MPVAMCFHPASAKHPLPTPISMVSFMSVASTERKLAIDSHCSISIRCSDWANDFYFPFAEADLRSQPASLRD